MVKNNYYVYNVLGNQYTINGAAKEYRISIDHVSSNVCIKKHFIVLQSIAQVCKSIMLDTQVKKQ